MDDVVRSDNSLRTIIDSETHTKIIVLNDTEYIDLELSPYQKYFISIMANRKLPDGNE